MDYPDYMAIFVFNLFSVGIGPSSSHTVGPMRAAREFTSHLQQQPERVVVDLYGSLALTGKGHGTDKAVLLGLMGETPSEVEPNEIPAIMEEIRARATLKLMGMKAIPFHEEHDLLFHKDKQLPFHPNGMRFTAFDSMGKQILSEVWYSVGGGFIVSHAEAMQDKNIGDNLVEVPFPFATAAELLRHCAEQKCTIPELMLKNESLWRSPEETKTGLLAIWATMQGCIERGCREKGELPGGLHVKRRAAELEEKLEKERREGLSNPLEGVEWVSVWALAVNEENAAGGRVVTAPTNGAAGVIPAVLKYYETFVSKADKEGVLRFLLTAAAIGILYKRGASISAAEMGCMGEVGVACSMAAGGLTAALEGTTAQIENAAEIGMEHNLGLTCDPVQGLVQIPCIERNTMGALKAINAALLSLRGDGTHRVSLDQVIATMRQTGKDMKSIYKETSEGGLAVNVPEC